MYSQHDEEQILLEIFSEHESGKLLDLGAYDGKTFSNSLALIEKGWSGVLVEASPHAFDALRKNLHDFIVRGQVEAVCAAMSFERGLQEFYECEDAVSTFSEAEREKWETGNNNKYWPVWVSKICIEDILSQFEGPFDFVNIDIEGYSADFFLRTDWSAMKPKAVCIEHDGRVVELCENAKQYGYQKNYTNGTNVIFEL